ncbi:MAG: peptidylprolyl isomerase [Oscillospiraceae bacterium]|nr:peptidylprolyl isomerase [Oscillospiraceae bacterium]
MFKKLITGVMCVVLSVSMFASCSAGSEKKSGSIYDSSKSESDYQQCLDDQSGYTGMVNYTAPKDGEEIVVLTIKDRGEVKIKLFPELLPKACANFVGLVQGKYYDGLTFHRVIEDFMIHGGDPTGTGRGGESVWGAQFDGGVSKYLYHVKGALAYANSGSTSTDGSQFYITVGDVFTEDLLKQYKTGELPEEASQAYIKDGGTPWLDGGYTVFGQVFEGMDLVEDICNNTETDTNNKPTSDVIIEKAEVVTYHQN